MSNKTINKLITKIKTKLNKKDDYLIEEYKFSNEEIENLKEQNKQKLENLKNNNTKIKSVSFSSVTKKLDGLLNEEKNNDEEKIEEESNKIIVKEIIKDEKKDEDDNIKIEETISKEELKNENEVEKLPKEIKKQETLEKESYINLTQKTQDIIMKSWNAIDLQQIDKDIIEGKDLLNHNYNITYGDNAAKFVHDIRKKYEIVICYLIGFNNEKKGIMNKTTFADKVDDEWKYLNKYIKLLEKIRNFRK